MRGRILCSEIRCPDRDEKKKDMSFMEGMSFAYMDIRGYFFGELG